MAKKHAIKTVTLRDEVWSRGGGSYLLWHDNGDRRQQCCIGIACTAFGIPDEAINELSYAHYVKRKRLPAPIRRLATLGEELQSKRAAKVRDIASELDVYRINDSGGFADDHERVRQINAALAKDGVPLRFRFKAASRHGARTKRPTLSTSASEAP